MLELAIATFSLFPNCDSDQTTAFLSNVKNATETTDVPKKKIALARDLQQDMKEATAVHNYSCAWKGNYVHRVKKDLKVLLDLDEEAVRNK